ncbi:DNA alkylation repair protein [Candidatus Peregrinibacteria bacterium]|nr:DNA alkylation repair protein [Candidatus Peregrinibacteria bacterium]
MLTQTKKELNSLANEKQAKNLARFFKTGKGQYGEGDKFLGIKVPIQRKVAKKFQNINLSDLKSLLSSPYHEHRLTALIILNHKFQKAQSEKTRTNLVKIYISQIKYINNWDLVDLSAPQILGVYLEHKPKDILYKYANSNNLWKKRIAILSTFHFIKNSKFEDTLKISKILLKDDHDLIHKAVGWMLREIGNRDLETEENFLKKHYKKMPRTMLRYAIEKFEESHRQKYLKGLI